MALQIDGLNRLNEIIYNQQQLQSQLAHIISQNDEQLALQQKILTAQDTANLIAWLRVRQAAGDNGIVGLNIDPELVREIRERLGV